MKTIKEIAQEKKLFYQEKYKQFVIDNPDIIRSGYLSNLIGCEYAEFCDEITELDTLIKVFKGKQGNATGTNGFRWIVEAIENVKEEYEEQKKIDNSSNL